MSVANPLDTLFSLENSGGMRVFLFAKFYEDLLRSYFAHKGYNVLPGKPQIFWNKTPLPPKPLSPNHTRLINRLKDLQANAQYAIPDGLFVRNSAYYLWEAKNWIQELYPAPFADRVWDFAWLLAKKARYRGHDYPLAGFLISWWEREEGMEDTLSELRNYVSPQTVDVIITKEVLEECIREQYDWYQDLIAEKRENIEQFFDILLGK